ncbi:hypothetical protein ABIA39_006226 [Nocardia sp. GAS34]|uniref:conjugal transfer protein n=1 Tax=unclassified Nocardia TaxID=2637762 RepID=UPI003D24AE73
MAVLAVLAVLGGVNAVAGFFSTPPKGPSDDSTTLLIGHAQLAGSFARDFVVAYVGASSGQQGQLDRYVSTGQQITLPSAGLRVTDPAVVHIARDRSVGNLDIWAVTVSVRVGAATVGAATPTASGDRQYYRVAVSESEGSLRALSLPAVVQPPAKGSDLALGYTGSCTTDTPLAKVSSEFLTAFLTGAGDITRYVSLNSGIAALQPAPFSSLDTVSVQSDDRGCGTGGSAARVQILVNPKSAAGAAPTLAYSLSMVLTAGQWQVQTIDPLPQLRTPVAVIGAQQPGSGPGTAPTTAATTTSSAPTAQIPPATQN